uniref:Myomodulin receptor 2 n=1 Tax=Platynereis dumerilii TaxID=6359 RepID=A0A291FEA6_PLADU|nr:myomodulin receptor 2 [Platynereis dumerilii]
MEEQVNKLNFTVDIRTLNESNVTYSSSSNPCEGSVFFFVIYGPLWGTVCLFGLIGNSLSFAVLHRYSPRNVATLLLKALAVSDNLFLATGLFSMMFPAMMMSFDLISQLEPIYPYIQTFGWPLTHMTQMGTVWMTVLVAFNRYIAVCKPLHAPRLATKSRVQVQIAVMVICIILYTLPRFFEYNYVLTNVTTAENITIEQEVNVGLITYRLYNILYENISYWLFLFLVPLLILIFLNAHLVKELKAAQRNREALTSRSSSEENNVTLVMIVIIVVFIVCQTPASINQVLFFLVADAEKSKCGHYIKYYHISNLLLIGNSSVNFIIYCVFRRQFQQDLFRLICRGKARTRAIVRTRFTASSYRSTSGERVTESVPLTPNILDHHNDHKNDYRNEKNMAKNGLNNHKKWPPS